MVSKVLGVVVIGGMITSTLNSFVVIPVLYEAMNRRKPGKKLASLVQASG
ncbi:hypothetical protein [Paenibacillus pabuli]|nr:hypothetical protein [Paenibacillus pabuli]